MKVGRLFRGKGGCKNSELMAFRKRRLESFHDFALT